jgi:hypothetical protein
VQPRGDGAPEGPDNPDDAAGSRSQGPYDDLGEAELIELISSLETEALERLRHYEALHGRRRGVLQALDRNLARRESNRPS